MRIERMPVHRAASHLLVYNLADANGRRLVRKGECLMAVQIAMLREWGQADIEVAILEADDVMEDD
jgi:hypothetical protein